MHVQKDTIHAIIIFIKKKGGKKLCVVQPDVLIHFQSSYLCELKKKMTQKRHALTSFYTK